MTAPKKSVLAWHFVGDALRDGRPVPKDGEVLEHSEKLVMCQSGLHASIKLRDALQYAPGNIICRVRVGGRIVKSDDKLIASSRVILWRVNGERILRSYARWCALQVVHLWNPPQIVLNFLNTGDESIRAAAWDAARAAAWDAAGDAAWDAARAATWAAAWAAARAAAWDAAGAAAGDAAGDAAWAAAGAAAWAAARAAQNNELTRLVMAAHKADKR